MVTFLSSDENIVANSTLITPPPMIIKLSHLILGFVKKSSLVNTPSVSIPGILGIAGLDPVAIKILPPFTSINSS